MSAIKTEYTPGIWQRIGSMLVPLAATGLVLFAVAIGAASVVFMAVGIEAVKAIAAAVLCIGGLAPASVIGAVLVYNQHQHVKLLAGMVQPEPVRVIEQAPRQLEPPKMPALERYAEVGAGHWVDTTSPRALAQVAYEQLRGQGMQPSGDNIKTLLGLTDNAQVTSIQRALADAGLAYKDGDNRTAPWRWVHHPAPAQ